MCRAEPGGTNRYVFRLFLRINRPFFHCYHVAGRFSRMLMKKIAQHPGSGGAVVDNTAVEDEDVGRVLRQVCWQWGLVMDREEWRRRIEGGGL